MNSIAVRLADNVSFPKYNAGLDALTDVAEYVVAKKGTTKVAEEVNELPRVASNLTKEQSEALATQRRLLSPMLNCGHPHVG